MIVPSLPVPSRVSITAPCTLLSSVIFIGHNHLFCVLTCILCFCLPSDTFLEVIVVVCSVLQGLAQGRYSKNTP